MIDLPLPTLGYNARMTEAKTSAAAPTEHDAVDALVARIAQRDQAALAQLYDATAGRAYALARRITREVRGAEEVVSDVYLQVWQQASRYDAARGRALTWLLTICRSRALDHLRRRDAAELHPAPDTLRPDLYRGDNDPLDLAAALERDSYVRAALATLGETERRLLGLAFFRGLSHQEIADHTGMPLGSVKTVLRRALQALRERLGYPALVPEETS